MRQQAIQGTRPGGRDGGPGGGENLLDLGHALRRLFQLHGRSAVHGVARRMPGLLRLWGQPPRRVVHAKQMAQQPGRALGHERLQGVHTCFQRSRDGADRRARLGGGEEGRPGRGPGGGVVAVGVDDAHRQVEVLFKPLGLGLKLRPGRPRGVHVVEQQHARDAQLPNLKDQEQLALQRPGVGHQQNDVRVVFVLGIEKDALGDASVFGLGMQVVDARQVVQQPRFGARVLARSRSHIDGDPREVAHRHRGPGELLKHGGFARVGVADKCQFHSGKGRRFGALCNPPNGAFRQGEAVIVPSATFSDRPGCGRCPPPSKPQSAGRCCRPRRRPRCPGTCPHRRRRPFSRDSW